MMKATILLTLLTTALVAGCLEGDNTVDDVDDRLDPATDGALTVQQLIDAAAAAGVPPMVFNESVVDAAVSVTNDLYEPTMEVSADGTIFVTGHTAVVDTTGAPVYGSWDDGATWSQLPWFRDQTMPAGLPGATPPVTDEIFLVAGDGGWLYGVDITLATFPVNAWSGDGAQHSYFNANAYDDQQVLLQADQCIAAPAKDRPWAAYADGSLLMVSNPAAGPAQIGILDVPSGPLGLVEAPLGLGTTTGGGRWNVCAGIGYHTADNSIPGIPGMRDDGLFAVPQRGSGELYLIMGNKMDIFQLDVFSVFSHTTGGEITSVYGIADFDVDGNLFVGISNNTAPDEDDNRTGGLHFAVSTDDGTSFEQLHVDTGVGAPVRHFYMDGNRFGPGALAVWAVDGETTDTNADGEEVPVAWDWYAAHLHVGADGAPELRNTSLIIDEGKRPSPHVTGASVGPDGRAYTAMYEGAGMGGTPISVFIQRDGPTLPVTVPADDDA